MTWGFRKICIVLLLRADCYSAPRESVRKLGRENKKHALLENLADDTIA